MYSLGGGGYKATGSGAGYGASGLVAMVGERSDGERESSVRDGRAGGETGIRTLDTLSSIHAFQACAFSHSAISPLGKRLAEALDPEAGIGSPQGATLQRSFHCSVSGDGVWKPAYSRSDPRN